MPLYDYRCRACHRDSELLIKGESTPLCPHCGSQKMDKLLAAPIAPGRSKAIIQRARQQAAKEGHFSHYSKKERAKLK